MRVELGLLLVVAACGGSSSEEVGPDAALVDAGPLPDARPAIPFIVGLSHMASGVEDFSEQLGIHWVRQTLGWDALEPVVAPSGLTLEQAMSREALETFTATHDFSDLDWSIKRFTDRGMLVVAGVGSGWNRSIPQVADGRPAAPDVIGKDEYVARQVLVVRAIVERYDGDGYLDAPGSPKVTAWQVENELNEALATAVGSSRYPGGLDALSSTWKDFDYVDHLFHALVAAVRDVAPPGSIVLTNFHTSVTAALDASLGVPTWQEVVQRWRGELDWIGLDTYPNYINAMPLGTAEIADTVAQAVELSETRPVVIIETSYGSGPAVLGYDEALQEQFLKETYAAVRAAGGSGMFWFGTRTGEAHGVDISERDVDILHRLYLAYAAGDVREIYAIMSEDTVYFENHMSRVIDASGGYQGLVRRDGTHKPAWDRLAEEAAR